MRFQLTVDFHTVNIQLFQFSEGHVTPFRTLDIIVENGVTEEQVVAIVFGNVGSLTFRVEFARKWLAAWAEIMMPLKAQYISGANYLSVLAMRRGLPPGGLVFSLYLQPS